MLAVIRSGEKMKIDLKGTTVRSNPKDVAMKWKKELSSENITLIEKSCQKTMKLLGYANFSNQKNLAAILSKSKKEIWANISNFMKTNHDKQNHKETRKQGSKQGNKQHTSQRSKQHTKQHMKKN